MLRKAVAVLNEWLQRCIVNRDQRVRTVVQCLIESCGDEENGLQQINPGGAKVATIRMLLRAKILQVAPGP